MHEKLSNDGGDLPRATLIGRAFEEAAISERLDAALAGRGSAVVVRGEAGIGKTRLLRAALAGATGLGAQVVCGAGEELDAASPLVALTAAPEIAPKARAPEITEALRRVAKGPPFAAVDAAADAVEEWCGWGPLVVAVDDVQWADPVTLTLLHRLGRGAAYLPLLMVIALRPVPRQAPLDALVEGLLVGGALDLTLKPLDDRGVRELAGRLIDAPVGDNLARQLSATNGNPLYVVELVGALRHEGALRPAAGGRVDTESTDLPLSLLTAVSRRLRFLPSGCRELLRLAAVLGRRFAAAELASLTRRPVSTFVGDLDHSVTAGVLEEANDSLSFRHDVIRQTLYNELTPSVRAALHLEASEALRAAGAPAERWATHLLRGAGAAGEAAGPRLRAAAFEVASRAPGLAVELVDLALALDPVAGDRDALLAHRAHCLLWSGRLREAETTAADVLARDHDPDIDVSVRLCLVESLSLQARLKESRIVAEAGAESTAGAGDRARLRAMAAFGRLFEEEVYEAEKDAELALADARAAETDMVAAVLAHQSLAMVRHAQGRFRDAADLLSRAVALADRSPGGEGHRSIPALSLGFILLDLDRPDEALASIQRGRIVGEQLGTFAGFHQVSGYRHFALGEWGDALAELQAAISVLEGTGVGWWAPTFSVRALIAHHQDRPEAARADLETAKEHYEATGSLDGPAWLALARARLAERDGRPDEARAVLTSAFDHLGAVGRFAYDAALGPDLARLAVAAGDHEHVAAVAGRLQALAGMNPEVPSLRAAVEVCRGLTAGDPEVLAGAAVLYREARRPLEAGMASLEAALLLGDGGRHEDAHRLAVEGVADLERIGAYYDIARAEARLRAAGVRLGRRGPRRRPQTGWESLTPTELRVLDLVVAGHSNPDIADRLLISRNTVRAHVSSLLAKLGVASRVELAVTAARRERPPE